MNKDDILHQAAQATRTHSMTERRFSTVFGVHPCTMNRCYSYIPEKDRPPFTHLFYSFYWYKNYNPADCCAMVFDINEKDYISTTWKTTELLNRSLPEVCILSVLKKKSVKILNNSLTGGNEMKFQVTTHCFPQQKSLLIQPVKR